MTDETPSAASRIATSTAICAVAGICVAAIAALAIAVAGLGDEMRDVLQFGFGGVRHSPSEVASIAVHNGRFAAGTLACAVLAPRVAPSLRSLMTALLATLLAVNAATVGVAIGAYGTRVLRPHVALELAALSLVGGAYVQATRRSLSTATLAVIAAGDAVLLAAAATLETYVSFGGAGR